MIERMNEEKWLPIPGFEGLYEISDRGSIRTLPRPRRAKGGTTSLLPTRIMRQHRIGRAGGYWATYLTPQSGPRKRVFAHVAVLEAFVNPRPDGQHACHNDGDMTNNHVDNLRWDTPSANMIDRVQHGNHFAANRELCAKGHPYDRIERYPDGSFKQRYCNTCKQESKRAHRERVRSDYCANGHLFDGTKTMRDGSIRRYCTICVRKHLVNRPRPPAQETCHRGHSKDVVIRRDGSTTRVCKVCQRDARLRHEAKKLSETVK